MQVYKVDGEGYFVEIAYLEYDDNGEVISDFDYVEVRPTSGLHKPRWVDNDWIEAKTEEEFLEDEFLKALMPTREEEENAKFEIRLIEKLTEWGIV